MQSAETERICPKTQVCGAQWTSIHSNMKLLHYLKRIKDLKSIEKLNKNSIEKHIYKKYKVHRKAQNGRVMVKNIDET